MLQDTMPPIIEGNFFVFCDASSATQVDRSLPIYRTCGTIEILQPGLSCVASLVCAFQIKYNHILLQRT